VGGRTKAEACAEKSRYGAPKWFPVKMDEAGKVFGGGESRGKAKSRRCEGGEKIHYPDIEKTVEGGGYGLSKAYVIQGGRITG